MVWTDLHLIIQQDKRKEMRGCRGRRWRWQRMDFPLCVAMVTAVDGGWLISCTAVELGGERERGTQRYLCGGGRRWSSVRKASIFSLKLWGYLWWLGFFSAWMLHEWLFVLCRWIFFWNSKKIRVCRGQWNPNPIKSQHKGYLLGVCKAFNHIWHSSADLQPFKQRQWAGWPANFIFITVHFSLIVECDFE